MLVRRLLVSSLLAAVVFAFPLLDEPTIHPNQVLCQLPIISKFLCPRVGLNSLQIRAPIARAYGTQDSSGAIRFTVKYATAPRWAPSTMVSVSSLSPGAINATSLPLACPQPGVDPSTYTEDCLYMVIYVPSSLDWGSSASTLMWLHGGSFIAGSATAPGLNGSNLAIATNSIVAVVQYRLGALGFMSPDGTTNLAVNDVINAMQFLHTVVPAFGGSASKITLAGQSSGANMIRALLATPSASSLFQSAILQSDPMNYGFLSPKTQVKLQNAFNGMINCTATDVTCRNSLSLDSILSAQSTLFQTAFTLDPSTGSAEPIRPVLDGRLITSPLDATAPFPSVTKPLLLSTVLNEAGFAIYGQFPTRLPADYFSPICNVTFGEPRTVTIVHSAFYRPMPLAGRQVDTRTQLQALGTDYLWRCSSWTFARNWVGKGGKAYVGQYQIGATYPGNNAVPFCTTPGAVCHQDDIQIVFGTVPKATTAQAALTKEMQRRYKAFLSTGNPNVAGYAAWTAATSSNVHALKLGGSGEVIPGACDPSFWGAAVQYDYQFYAI